MNLWAAFARDLVDQGPLILRGLGDSLLLTVIISLTGFLLGLVVFYLRHCQVALIRLVMRGYISFFIGMPLIVLLFLMYYGLPQWGVSLSPFTVAVIGFTFNVAAYNAAYLTTAYHALDAAELEAARAAGFRPFQVFRLITLPQVLRLSVPALTNQVIRNLKDSSVAFLIQFNDFFARVQELAATNFMFFRSYLFAAVVYLLLVLVLVLIARQVERRVMIPGVYIAPESMTTTAA
ncbi:MAG: ABC transporter permease subunit [Xanthomonadales bacterium]|nr:ABC transporter permease subunit [Xanthomonadales bacterium]NIX13459.1 ABC transporter permease subunit [Xanthomonadales bacterium]